MFKTTQKKIYLMIVGEEGETYRDIHETLNNDDHQGMKVQIFSHPMQIVL